MKCPQCGEAKDLQILAQLWVQPGQDEDGYPDPIAGEPPIYNDRSFVECLKCQHHGAVGVWEGRLAPAAVKIDTPKEAREPVCPKCRAPMILRENKSNGSRFWGCMTFPLCRGTSSHHADL